MKQWYWDVITGKYAEFSGRTGVKSFWMFVLYNFIIGVVFSVVIAIFGDSFLAKFFNIIYTLYGFAILIPSLAIAVRRLHDIGKRWTWLLIALIPLAGAIWLIVLYCQPSIPQENEFGPVPEV